MTTTLSPGRIKESIHRAGAGAVEVDEFFAELSDLVSRAVPFDGSMWFGVDPSTLLASAPARVERMDHGLCWPFWHGEFNANDVLTFRDLARSPSPVGSLHDATGGRLVRSPRYRDFLAPQGYADELRVAFRTGSTTWAVAGLYREQGRDPFSEDERELMASLSPTVGAVLRARSIRQPTADRVLDSPGILVFDRDSRLVSATAEAKGWLSALFGPHADDSWTDLLAREMTDPLMSWPIIQSLVSRAYAVAAGYDDGPVRLRLLDRSGRWVVLHASVLDSTDPTGFVAVVVEPAKSAEIAPIVVEAYGLAPREREVVQAVARGLSTPEIASSLFLSGHTVRDYLKSVFEKVGVSSRGELVAKLFAEHYLPDLHAEMVSVE